MKYLIIKSLPFAGFEEGAVIDATGGWLYLNVDFTNTEYFKPVIESNYIVGQELVLSTCKGSFLVKVESITNGDEAVNHLIPYYSVKQVNGINRLNPVREERLSLPKWFWFINSDGEVCCDYEQRKGISQKGLAWKQMVDNYYTSEENAKSAKELLTCLLS